MTAIVLLLLIPLSAPPAPPAADRTVAELVADLRGPDGDKSREAHLALVALGPKAKSAVPELTKMLSEKGARYDYATEILGAIGPGAKEAVPALLALLPKEPGAFLGYGIDRTAYALAQIDGAKFEATRALLLSSTKGNPIALTVSGTLHSYPSQVIPHLITLCGDKDATVRAKAATVLGHLKDKPTHKVPPPSLYEKAAAAVKGIPAALEKLLADESTEVKLAAAQAITHVTPELAEKAVAVVVALAIEAADKPKQGVHAVEVFQPVPELAAKTLIPLFDHSNDYVHYWAVNTLCYVQVREPLEGALKTGKTARIRRGAAETLGSRYGDGAASAPVLKEALKDAEFVVRFAAAEALVNVTRRESGMHAAAIPALIEGLQQNEERVRIQATQTLLTTGPVAKQAVPALKKLLADDKPTVRLEAALALVGIDAKEAEAAVPALTDGLKAGDSSATRAAKALAELGPVAKVALPELLKHFDAKAPRLRLHAAEAVGRIDPAQGPKAAAVLIELLQVKKGRSSMVRGDALRALLHIGQPAKPAMPTLAELLKDDGPFHAEAALAMIAIDPEGAKPAIEWVRAALESKNGEDAHDLAEALPALGAKAKPLVPELMLMLKAKVPFQRTSAITALGAIGPDARAALGELRTLAEKDPRKDVREAAAEAVKKIEAK